MAKYLIFLCLLVGGCVAKSATKAQRWDPNLSWRIIGGSDAPEGAYPYTASLQLFGRHGCGVAIIAPDWVVTSAACVYEVPLNYLTVAAGSNKLSEAISYDVVEVIIHHDYNSQTDQNDLALLRVQTIANVSSIAIETEEVGGDIDVVFTGWGLNRTSQDVPDNLQYINLKTMTYRECKAISPTITENNVCTSTDFKNGMCFGDNGGPLVRNVEGEARLVGILSWGIACATGHPDVHTRASTYRSWLNEKCNCL